jgi:hypothetical protein
MRGFGQLVGGHGCLKAITAPIHQSSLLSKRFADIVFVNPAPDLDVGTCCAMGDDGLIVVIKFIVAAEGDVFGIEAVETASGRFLPDFVREFGMTGGEKGVVDGFGIFGVEDHGGEVGLHGA